MISYDYYKVFYYVCKYRNFTKAANVLITSQSGVSHTIQNLEHQLGCRLFNRNNRGIELTPEGKCLYEYISLGCEQFLKGEAEILNASSIECGNIYLGTTETALHCFLFDVLDKFHLKYPMVKYKINNFTTNDAVNALKNGVVDLAVTATPFDITPNMKSIFLKKIQDVLIAGPMYKSIISSTITLEELCKYPFISYSTGSQSRLFTEKIFSDNNLVLNPTIESATSDLILPMVKHNLGLGFIPYDMAEESLMKNEVILIHTTTKIPIREICLVYDTHHPHSSASNEFIKFISQQAESFV